MKKAIHIKIPEPCHKDWGEMTPTEKGRHCASCEKEVIDFTEKSDEDLFKILKANPTSCGRFKKSQVGREIKLERKGTASFAPYAASLLVPLTLLGSLNSKASSKDIETEKVFKSIGIGRYSKQADFKGKTKTTGVVTTVNGEPIRNVEIISSETKVTTYTNSDGYYELICFDGETLTFEKENFTKYEFITKGFLTINNITLQKEQEPITITAMGGAYIRPVEVQEDMGEMIVEKDVEKVVEKLQKENTISGIITDTSGLPLAGVNIIAKGTTHGTQTDFDGRYRLGVEDGQILVFSYVGFKTEERSIDRKITSIHISLNPGDSLMGKVVITGGYITLEPEGITATRPFGNVSFAFDWNTEQARRKQKETYDITKKFHRRKLKEKKEARKLKRQENKEQQAKKKEQRTKKKEEILKNK